jgi:predicted NodU family carbamoyl transferase
VFEVGNNIILISNTSFNVQSGEPEVTSHKDCIRDYIIHFVIYFIEYISPKE